MLSYIKSNELKEIIDSGNNDFMIVDIREPEEYNDWNIKESINLPINGFLAKGNIKAMNDELMKLPKDKKIIVVCMRGINSQVASTLLSSNGYEAYTLSDGLKGWNQNLEIYEINFDYVFTITQFLRTGKGCLSYIVFSDSSKEGIVFDASVITGEYLKYIKEKGLKIKYVIDTHTHADHFSGGIALAKMLNSEYLVNIHNDGYQKFVSPESVVLDLENVAIKVFKTLGHTDDSLSFLINNKALICGDLLLLESPGRPDLARDKKQTIEGANKSYDTIHNVILSLDETVKILPGHIVSTPLRPAVMTLKELLKQHEGVMTGKKEDYINFITENIPPTPPNFETIKKYNLAGVAVPNDYAEDLEIGPNRCGSRNK